MEDGVHLGKAGGGHVLFLSPARRAMLRLVHRANQKRTRTARRIANLDVFLFTVAKPDDLCKNTGNFRRGVELSFALAALRGEVFHQVFVSVADDVVATGLVFLEVQLRALENGDKRGQLVLHFLSLAQLRLVVEMHVVDDVFQRRIRRSHAGDDFVHALADVLVAFQRNKIIEAAPGPFLGVCLIVVLFIENFNFGIATSLEFVRHIFHEKQRQHIVLILRSVHSAAQSVAARPKRAV